MEIEKDVEREVAKQGTTKTGVSGTGTGAMKWFGARARGAPLGQPARAVDDITYLFPLISLGADIEPFLGDSQYLRPP